MKRFSAALIGTVFLAFAVTRLNSAKPKDDPQPPTLTKEAWRQDLRYFAEQLPKRHKNLYHAVSREQFERAVADLNAAICCRRTMISWSCNVGIAASRSATARSNCSRETAW